ncbi:MAG: DUF885 domain-containing protein [Chitinophagales bacterium]
MNKFQIGCFLFIFLLFSPSNFMDAQIILKGGQKTKKSSQKAQGISIDIDKAQKMKQNSSNSQSFASFKEYKEYFFKSYWSLNPEYAAYLGLSEYDTKLSVPSEANRKNHTNTYEKLLGALMEIDQRKLSNEDKTDYALIKNDLESSIWYNQVFRSYEWNPSFYNIGGSFDRLVSDKEMPTAEKLKKLFLKMKYVPTYYKAAIHNIKNPTLEHSQLAAYQISGTLNIFDQKIQKLAAEAQKEDWNKISKKEFEENLKNAIEGIKFFEVFLNKKVLPFLQNPDREIRSFRIGEELYNQKFQFDIQSGYTAKELYDIAMKEKTAIHQKMFGIADKLWSKYFPTTRAPNDKMMKVEILIDEISQKHVKRDEFMDAIKKQLPELVAFVKEKDILYLDPAKPLEVRATPEYMRGTAGASISAPGPFDKDAATYYNVTPLDHYNDDQAESYLKEYNHYMLQILNIHEAIPGHYAQLVYANQSPSLVKSIFGNGAMIEGWACYTERMMLEEGYGNHAPELWLMYYKWNLRIVCNTILDYSVHALNMNKEEALKLLTQEAFQEQTEAEGKWSRVQLTQVQLCSYFAGLTEIYNFRQEKKRELGDAFNLKSFHERFLSFGSAPVKEIKKLMNTTSKRGER